MTMQRPVDILLVEDSPADARLAREALMRGPVPKRITVVRDGAEAIDYLRQRGDFAQAARPDIVLLDLNLPKRDGLEVLTDIKSDPLLRSITVIVLTTSSFPSDVTRAYELLANCYIVKPSDLDRFYAVMRGIEEFWMTMACLPTTGGEPAGRSDTARSSQARGEPKKGGASAHTRSAVHRPRSVPGYQTGLRRRAAQQ